MYLIIGLGNPGKLYEKTYHNCGFLTLDLLAEKFGVSIKKNECKALTAHLKINGEKVILAKPQTFMNLSGESVLSLTAKYKIQQESFIVVYDDIDLPLGTLRLREEGGTGSHNGMKSIVQQLGIKEFKRIRVGIDQPPGYIELKDFVTSKISENDFITLKEAFENAASALKEFCEGVPYPSLMQKYNRCP